MELAILFWFYKQPDVCKNHLDLLRRYNPSVPIYGLYGGDLNEIDKFKSLLDRYLDDLYVFTQDKDSLWKWHLGDLLIADWYSERGQYLSWDTVIIVQWDMLVFGSVQDLFSMLQQDQILLSGLRKIKEIEEKWSWTSEVIIPKLRDLYLNFLAWVKEKYHYDQDPLCCLFIVVCFPRSFLAKYSEIEQPELGFLEYRVPIYAQIFGTLFCVDHPFQPWWPGDSTTSKNRETLNAKRHDVGLISIVRNLMDSNGVRVFHPYRKVFPLKAAQWWWIFAIFVQELLERLVEAIKRIRYQQKY